MQKYKFTSPPASTTNKHKHSSVVVECNNKISSARKYVRKLEKQPPKGTVAVSTPKLDCPPSGPSPSSQSSGSPTVDCKENWVARGIIS